MTYPRMERHRLVVGWSHRFYYCPKVVVYDENGWMEVVGNKIDVTADLQPYLLACYRQPRSVAEQLRSPDPLSASAQKVLTGARRDLRRRGMTEFDSGDAVSEAIEAAEALGL